MRIVQKKFKVFEFEELSDDAKDKAVEDYTGGDYPAYDWWNGDEDFMQGKARERGIEIKSRETYGLEFWFDIDHREFGFEGGVGNQSLFARAVMNLQRPDMRKCKEYEYWTRFLRCVDHGAIDLFFSCRESNFYGTQIESGIDNMVASESDLVGQFDDILEGIKDVVRDFNGDMLSALREEYERLFDRDYVVEEIEINDYEFYMDGTMYHKRQFEIEETA